MANELDLDLGELTSFYCSEDKNLKKFDDKYVIEKITEKYPDFVPTEKEPILKKLFLTILDDDAFMKEILKYFDISLYEFIVIVYREYTELFNSYFNTSLQALLRKKSYARAGFKPRPKRR